MRLLPFAVLGMTFAVATEDSPQPAGVVEFIHGKCFVRRASDPKAVAKAIRLVGELVYVEDSLRCDPGGTVTVHLGYLEKTLTASKEEYPVPLAPSVPPDARQRFLAEALRDYGTPGGRPRSTGAVLFSPPRDGVADPANVVVRWNPWPGTGKVSLEIRAQDGSEVFRKTGIAGLAGQFESEELRGTLLIHQQRDSTARLLLSIHSDGDTHPRDAVEFGLLSLAEQELLRRDLDRANGEASPLLRHVARAYAFSSRRLWTEAAMEYEATLRDVPESEALLKRAIRAESDTGNDVKQRQLARRLRDMETKGGRTSKGSVSRPPR